MELNCNDLLQELIDIVDNYDTSKETDWANNLLLQNKFKSLESTYGSCDFYEEIINAPEVKWIKENIKCNIELGKLFTPLKFMGKLENANLDELIPGEVYINTDDSEMFVVSSNGELIQLSNFK